MGHAGVCTMLLGHNENLSEKWKNCAAPPHQTADNGIADVYFTLLEHNANVNKKLKDDAMVLFQTAQESHVDKCTVHLKVMQM